MVTADCSADDAEETDEQVSREAFAALAQGKPHVSLKDLLNWDFVYALLAEVSLRLLHVLHGPVVSLVIVLCGQTCFT